MVLKQKSRAKTSPAFLFLILLCNLISKPVSFQTDLSAQIESRTFTGNTPKNTERFQSKKLTSHLSKLIINICYKGVISHVGKKLLKKDSFHSLVLFHFDLSFFLLGLQTVRTEKNSSSDYPLYQVLYLDDILESGPATYTWDDPNTLHPDFFLYFFSKKTQLHRLSTDSEPIVLPANIVEEYDQLFFTVTSEHMRQSNFYLPEVHSYQIPIISSSPSGIEVDEMSIEQDILTIRYTFYYPANHAAFRTGSVRIMLPDRTSSRTHRCLSCQVTELE